MANSNLKKSKLDFNKIKESIKKDKEFNLVEHEILKFVYIFNEIIKNAEENKEIEDIDNTDGVGDIINIVKNKLITLIHSDYELINNPLIKKAIKVLK